jgi:Skp family chaperone for outer membrane proteins
VKKSHRWAILAVVVSLGYLLTVAMAQNPSGARAPAAGPRLALLDVSKIFKTHPRFKLQMDEMKRDIQAAEQKVKGEREELAKGFNEGLATFTKGTQQYAEMEEQLANRQAKLQVDIQRTKVDFVQREAMIYHNVYQEIWQATDYFCRQNAIDMVLKFNADAVDVQRPDTVIAFINRPVVWYDPGLDITDAILRDVNRPAANTPGANNPGADQRGAQPASPFNRK